MHLALDHHGPDEFPDVVDTHDVVLQDVGGHPIEELENSDWSGCARDFFVLNRTNRQIVNVFQLHEVVNFLVERVLVGKKVADECLLSQ